MWSADCINVKWKDLQKEANNIFNHSFYSIVFKQQKEQRKGKKEIRKWKEWNLLSLGHKIGANKQQNSETFLSKSLTLCYWIHSFTYISIYLILLSISILLLQWIREGENHANKQLKKI